MATPPSAVLTAPSAPIPVAAAAAADPLSLPSANPCTPPPSTYALSVSAPLGSPVTPSLVDRRPKDAALHLLCLAAENSPTPSGPPSTCPTPLHPISSTLSAPFSLPLSTPHHSLPIPIPSSQPSFALPHNPSIHPNTSSSPYPMSIPHPSAHPHPHLLAHPHPHLHPTSQPPPPPHPYSSLTAAHPGPPPPPPPSAAPPHPHPSSPPRSPLVDPHAHALALSPVGMHHALSAYPLYLPYGGAAAAAAAAASSLSSATSPLSVASPSLLTTAPSSQSSIPTISPSSCPSVPSLSTTVPPQPSPPPPPPPPPTGVPTPTQPAQTSIPVNGLGAHAHAPYVYQAMYPPPPLFNMAYPGTPDFATAAALYATAPPPPTTPTSTGTLAPRAGGRTTSYVMRKVKGPWRPEEDRILTELVSKFGARRWTVIASHIPGRTGKQARERWLNQLSPDLAKRPWTVEEDRVVMQAHARLGNRWSEIAKLLKGRTDNATKNRFNTTIRRQISEIAAASAASAAAGAAAVAVVAEERPGQKRKRETATGCHEPLAQRAKTLAASS